MSWRQVIAFQDKNQGYILRASQGERIKIFKVFEVKISRIAALAFSSPIYYAETMERRKEDQAVKIDIEFNPSAFKHGVREADIRFAFDNKLFDHPIARQEEKNLLIGFDLRLNLLEILYNEIDEHTVNVFHAMKCRKAWRDLANL